ncbi:hypothetical protein [uncultured Rikenella sp.]|uniref:hypothetical protein n=1 Tax=uncultured Rikenella sp. TaxID=368003 RepID=UPI0025FE472D|nr:hypothetical protein [uncultured Rikenella sp.]
MTRFPIGARENAQTQHPAPGVRDAGNYGRLGGLMYVGRHGYSWSSAVSGTNGVFLDFNTQYLNPSYVDYRGHGFPLRCLSE